MLISGPVDGCMEEEEAGAVKMTGMISFNVSLTKNNKVE